VAEGVQTASNANALAQFDLIAVQPLDMPSFQYACTSLCMPSATSIDIITLDLASSARLPFHLKRSLVLNAIQQGVVFELVYGVTLRTAGPSVPKDARRNVFASAKELVRITKGRGLILSSAVQNCMELRAAPDLIALANSCMGMEAARAKMALEENARQAVLTGYSKRRAHKGTIKGPVVSVESLGRKRAAPDDDTEAGGDPKRARVDEAPTGPGQSATV
jgi:ribonuclease P/MRP protein subunit RPP1